MNRKCWKCGSTDLIKASLAHEAGTTELDSVTTGLGIGGDGLGVGLGKTKGTSQSLLAKRNAPPTPTSMILVLWLVGFFGSAWLCGQVIGMPMWGWGLVVVIMTFAMVPLFRAEAQSNRDQARKYRRKWLCRRCGATS